MFTIIFIYLHFTKCKQQRSSEVEIFRRSWISVHARRDYRTVIAVCFLLISPNIRGKWSWLWQVCVVSVVTVLFELIFPIKIFAIASKLNFSPQLILCSLPVYCCSFNRVLKELREVFFPHQDHKVTGFFRKKRHYVVKKAGKESGHGQLMRCHKAELTVMQIRTQGRRGTIFFHTFTFLCNWYRWETDYQKAKQRNTSSSEE